MPDAQTSMKKAEQTAFYNLLSAFSRAQTQVGEAIKEGTLNDVKAAEKVASEAFAKVVDAHEDLLAERERYAECYHANGRQLTEAYASNRSLYAFVESATRHLELISGGPHGRQIPYAAPRESLIEQGDRIIETEARRVADEQARFVLVEGSWPAVCLQRAFVEGAKWREFTKAGATMWPSDRNRVEEEAVRRFGEA